MKFEEDGRGIKLGAIHRESLAWIPTEAKLVNKLVERISARACGVC